MSGTSERARRREDRAGPAHAMLAAEMGAGEIAPLAQEIRQRQARRHVVDHGLAVHVQSDRTVAVTVIEALVIEAFGGRRARPSPCEGSIENRRRTAPADPRRSRRPTGVRIAGQEQFRCPCEDDRRAVDGAEHDAGMVAGRDRAPPPRSSSRTRRISDRTWNIPTAPAPSFGMRTLSMISSGARTVS